MALTLARLRKVPGDVDALNGLSRSSLKEARRLRAQHMPQVFPFLHFDNPFHALLPA